MNYEWINFQHFPPRTNGKKLIFQYVLRRTSWRSVLWFSVKLGCELPFCPMVRLMGWGTNSKRGFHLLQFIYYQYYLLSFISIMSWADRTIAYSGSCSHTPTCRMGQWVHFEFAGMKYSLRIHLPILSPDPTPRHAPNTSPHTHSRCTVLTHSAHARTTRERWQLKKLKIPLQNLLVCFQMQTTVTAVPWRPICGMRW